MKKTKQPGENISLKTKKTEDPAVMEWINAQTNLMDSLRYLIELEIASNGVRNLQTFIPVERNVLGAAASGGGFESLQAGRAQAAAASAAAMRPAPEPALPQETRADSGPFAPPEASAAAVPEDEIDEEDIEAWV